MAEGIEQGRDGAMQLASTLVAQAFVRDLTHLRLAELPTLFAPDQEPSARCGKKVAFCSSLAQRSSK